MSRTRLILPEIRVLAGGAILPAPAVPASTKISTRLGRFQGRVSPINIGVAMKRVCRGRLQKKGVPCARGCTSGDRSRAAPRCTPRIPAVNL